MSNNSTNPLLYVLIILVSINLAATAYLIAGHPQASASATMADIPEEKANMLANDVVKLYNSKDYEHLYQLLDPLAKVQITKDVLIKQLEQLYSLVGRVDSFAYSNSINAGSQGGLTYYQLLYKVRISGGQLDAGEMKLSVLNKNDKLSLVGLFINASSSNNAK